MSRRYLNLLEPGLSYIDLTSHILTWVLRKSTKVVKGRTDELYILHSQEVSQI